MTTHEELRVPTADTYQKACDLFYMLTPMVICVDGSREVYVTTLAQAWEFFNHEPPK